MKTEHLGHITALPPVPENRATLIVKGFDGVYYFQTSQRFWREVIRNLIFKNKSFQKWFPNGAEALIIHYND